MKLQTRYVSQKQHRIITEVTKEQTIQQSKTIRCTKYHTRA